MQAILKSALFTILVFKFNEDKKKAIDSLLVIMQFFSLVLRNKEDNLKQLKRGSWRINKIIPLEIIKLIHKFPSSLR